MNPEQAARGLPDTLLYTKLDIPLLGARVIRRTRLTERLQSALSQPVTLVVAPTGFGKTTLLCEWLSTQPAGAARPIWVSLDAFDNAPLRLWSYVAAGLKRVHPQMRFDPQNLIQRSQDPADRALLHPLFNEIAAYPHPLCLILDDYQAITDPQVHALVSYLIEHQPHNLHLVVSSRTAPPLHLSRLRAQRRLSEITAPDLAFSMSETRSFLTNVTGVEIDASQVASLWSASEGWIAGLQLSAHALKEHRHVRPVSGARCCGLPEILDYLSEEVLAHLDPETVAFLLSTSILSDLTAPLCDAVTQRGSSQAQLLKIAEDNLFLTALDDRHQWFRYHPLFAEALQAHLELEHPDWLPDLHRRACDWLQANGHPIKAVSHALAAGDLDRAAEIADACAMRAIITYDLTSLIQWISQFSEPLIQRRPRLGVYFALTTMFLGRVTEVEADVQRAERILAAADWISEADRHVARWELDVIRAAAQCWLQSRPMDITQARARLEQAPADDAFFIGFLNHSLAIALDLGGDPDAAAATFERGREFALAHSLHIQVVHSSCELASIRIRQGRLDEAEQGFKQALDFAVRLDLDEGVKAMARSGLLEIAVDRNDLETARRLAQSLTDHLDQIEACPSCWTFLAAIYARLAAFHIATQDRAAALRFAQQAFAGVTVHGRIAIQADEGTRLHDRSGTLLARLITGTDLHKDPQVLALGGQAEKLATARLRLRDHRPELALALIEPLEARARATGDLQQLIELKFLRGLAGRALGKPESAMTASGEALSLAVRSGYRRAFLDEGEPGRALLQDYLDSRSGIEGGSTDDATELARQLLASLSDVPAPTADPGPPDTTLISPMVDSLSEREREVLGMLLAGLTTKEVAVRLTISINTAKAHIKSVFRKLGIHRRGDLAHRAQALRLADQIVSRNSA